MPYGFKHLGVWGAQGHERPHSGPWCHILTLDTRDGGPADPKHAERAAAVEVYMQKVVPIEIGLSALYKALNPEAWESAKKHRDLLVEAGTGLQRYGEWQCQLTEAKVTNKNTSNHKDDGDARGVMALWTCQGEFTGADVCLTLLNERIRLLPGDAIFLHASVIDHCVTPIVGERRSAVWFSKSDASTIVQHRDFMSDEERADFDKIYLTTVAAKDATYQQNKLEEERLIREYRQRVNTPDEQDLPVDGGEWKLAEVRFRCQKFKAAIEKKAREIRAEKKLHPRGIISPAPGIAAAPCLVFLCVRKSRAEAFGKRTGSIQKNFKPSDRYSRR